MPKFSQSFSEKSRKGSDAESQADFDSHIGQARTIAQINRLPEEEKTTLYSGLIPSSILTKFRIDPKTFRNQDGEMALHCSCRPKTSTVRIELRHTANFPDPIFFLEMTDTPFADFEILFLNMNNPYSERFHIDRDAEGNDTVFATVSRNIPEEIRAMQAGLAPGQIRNGLRLFRSFLIQANQFCQKLGIAQVKVQPLAYHNAIMHEFYGFHYMSERRTMETIDREFAPGGLLFERLNGSTPFRQPGFERTIRGRSWAIHDGILEEPWQSPRMYYQFDESVNKTYDEFTCQTLSYRHRLSTA